MRGETRNPFAALRQRGNGESRVFRACAIWSGQEVGLKPQRMPSSRAMTSSTFMPTTSLLMP